MAELVDAPDLGSGMATCVSSSLFSPKSFNKKAFCNLAESFFYCQNTALNRYIDINYNVPSLFSRRLKPSLYKTNLYIKVGKLLYEYLRRVLIKVFASQARSALRTLLGLTK